MSAEGRKVWIEKHKEWLATVPGSKHIIVEKGHYFIQAQQPELVIEQSNRFRSSRGNSIEELIRLPKFKLRCEGPCHE